MTKLNQIWNSLGNICWLSLFIPGLVQIYQKRLYISFFQFWSSLPFWFLLLYNFNNIESIYRICFICFIIIFHMWSFVDAIKNAKDSSYEKYKDMLIIKWFSKVAPAVILCLILFFGNFKYLIITFIIFIWSIIDTKKTPQDEGKYERNNYPKYPAELEFIIIYTLIQGLYSLKLIFHTITHAEYVDRLRAMFHLNISMRTVFSTHGLVLFSQSDYFIYVMSIVIIVIMKKKYKIKLTPNIFVNNWLIFIPLCFLFIKGSFTILAASYGLKYNKKWALPLTKSLYILSFPFYFYNSGFYFDIDFIKFFAIIMSIVITVYLFTSKELKKAFE